MADINEAFERMIAEMRRYGATPAPSKGGSYNNMLRCREAREKILDRFLAAFADGYRLGKEDDAPTITSSGWVSVEDRLPEQGERVLATDGAFVGEGYTNCYGVWCRPNGLRWDMLDSDVTHWMPLPEPPKED